RPAARASGEPGVSPSGSSRAGSTAGDKPRRKRRFPYRKVDDLEAEIQQTEARVQQLQEELGNPDLYRDGPRVKETKENFERQQARLAELYEHWEEAVELN